MKNGTSLMTLVCLTLFGSAYSQYQCEPGEPPPLVETHQLEVLSTGPFCVSTMIPFIEVESAEDTVTLRIEPFKGAEIRGWLYPEEQGKIRNTIESSTGDIWHWVWTGSPTYYGGWCRSSSLVPVSGCIRYKLIHK
ncbi:MAG: hypothetical protein KAT09_02760, partial [Candidatus Aegiribacteria sp.]|nr:hypothetical protein [Candidatus Aegiribacteria sp.]